MTTNNIIAIKARRSGFTSFYTGVSAKPYKYRDSKGRFAKDPYKAFVREREHKWLFNEAQVQR